MLSRDCRLSFLLCGGLAVAALTGLGALWVRVESDAGLNLAVSDVLFSNSANHAVRLDDLSSELEAVRQSQEEDRQDSLYRDNVLRTGVEEVWSAGQETSANLRIVQREVEGLARGDSKADDRVGALEDALRPMLPPACGFAVPIFGSQTTTITLLTEDGKEPIMDPTITTEEADLGTGFVLEWSGKNILVTAGHLFSSEKREVPGVLTPSDGPSRRAILRQEITITAQWFVWKGQKVPIALVRSSVEPKDFAVGDFDQRLYDGPVGLCADSLPPEGSPLWVVTNRPDLRVGEVKVPGVYAGPKGGSSDVAYTHIAALSVWYGYSGSPVLYDGRVVGIVLHLYPGSVLGFSVLREILTEK